MTRTLAYFPSSPRRGARRAGWCFVLLALLLTAEARAGEIQIKKLSNRIFEVTGGSGAQGWHIQYGSQPVGGMRFATLAGPGTTAYFSHANWLRRVDVEKGIVTGRWHFPGAGITKLDWKDKHIQVEVEEPLPGSQPFRGIIDFDPEAPDVPYWPTGSLVAYNVAMAEGHCCLTYPNTLVLADTVNVDQAKMWQAEAENTVRRDPLSPWLRIELANIYRALGRPEAMDLYADAVRLPPANYTELLRISGVLDDIGQTLLAREAFERGYEDYWRRGLDPRFAFSLLGSIVGYARPRNSSEELRPEILERLYRLGPRLEYAEYAWSAYAQFLESKGKSEEARVWHRRAEDSRTNSLHPGAGGEGWIRPFSLVLIAVLCAALLYFAALYVRCRPRVRVRSPEETESGFRLGFFGVEYWSRPSRIAFFTIAAIGWLAIGSMGPFISVNARIWTLPLGMTMGSFAGSPSISRLETDLARSPERDLVLAIAYHQDRQTGKAEALYRQLSEYPESWNNLGAILKDSGKNDEARQAFERALQLNPEMHEARLNLGEPPSDLWTEFHRKYLPDRAMLAPPPRDRFLRAFGSEPTTNVAIQALQGPYAFARGVRDLRGITDLPLVIYVAATILLVLFLPALIIAVVKPDRTVTQRPGKTQTLVDLLLPGTAPEWSYFGGIVLVVWTCAGLVLISPLRDFTERMPNLQYAYGIPVSADSVPSVNPSGAAYFVAAIIALWVVNAVVISYRRRNTATIPLS